MLGRLIKHAFSQAITAIHNMSLQHREFINRLRDAEQLQLYVEFGLSAQESLDASLKEAQLTIQRLELEAKEVANRAAWAEIRGTPPDMSWR